MAYDEDARRSSYTSEDLITKYKAQLAESQKYTAQLEAAIRFLETTPDALALMELMRR